MSFISLNQISPGLISSGMGHWTLGHDHFTRDCCLVMRMAASRLLLTYQLMIMQNFANYLKFSETLAQLSSALCTILYVCCLQYEFHWLNALIAIVVVSSYDSSL